MIYFGDHGCNLKLLDWRANRVTKAGNHLQDLGFTDALSRHGRLLAATTYDIDTGSVENTDKLFVKIIKNSMHYMYT